MNKTDTILALIQVILKSIQTIPVIGTDAAVIAAFVTILQNALVAFEAANGAPLDVSKIPLETPVS